MINLHTTQKIINEKRRQLLKDHKSLLTRYLQLHTTLHLKSRKRILNYYDQQVTRANIEDHYNIPIPLFLIHLLT